MKKTTGRTIPIYPRVTTKNQKFLTRIAKEANKSQSEVINDLLTFAQVDKGPVRAVFSYGTKTGN